MRSHLHLALALACLALPLGLPTFAQTLYTQSDSPEAAPGLKIPSGNLPWALDTVEGKQQLVPVHPSAVNLNNHKGANLAGGLAVGPFYKAKMTTELAGTTARTPIHTLQPVFFVHLSEEAEAGESMITGWAVMRVTVDKDHRLLSTVKFTQLTGNAKRSDGQLEVTTEQLPHGWLKIAASAPLSAGEYALLPITRQANSFSTSVYDFRVDPAAASPADAVAASR